MLFRFVGRLKNRFAVVCGLTATLLLALLAFPFSGCAIFLLGAGAAGGYAVSKDEIEGIMDTPFERVYKSTKTVIQKEGALTLEDKERGKLEAVVEGSMVNANVEQVTPKTVRLRVKARKVKGLFPNVKVAQKIYTQAIKQVGG